MNIQKNMFSKFYKISSLFKNINFRDKLRKVSAKNGIERAKTNVHHALRKSNIQKSKFT